MAGYTWKKGLTGTLKGSILASEVNVNVGFS